MAKILIIEDNQTLNQVYTFILEKDGHQVLSTFDGEQGFKAFKKTAPDLVLLDLLMPRMDGITFLRKIGMPKKPKATIVVLSNLDEGQEIKKARELGITEYILKAKVSPTELAAQVNQIIQNSPGRSGVD